MKNLIKQLQHPTLQIFLSPLAAIFFGVAVGIRDRIEYSWLNILLLYTIAFSAHLLNHYLTIRYNRRNLEAAGVGFGFALEILLIVLSAIFMVKHGWSLNSLLILFILSIHLVYFPYNISLTGYKIFLTAFFQGFILNIIAYYSTAGMISNETLKVFAPFFILQLIVTYQVARLEKRSLNSEIGSTKTWQKLILLLGILGSVGSAVYLSLPTSSYYILQFIFVILSILVLIPILINTDSDHQFQNKINYLNAVTAIYAILYTVSYLY